MTTSRRALVIFVLALWSCSATAACAQAPPPRKPDRTRPFVIRSHPPARVFDAQLQGEELGLTNESFLLPERCYDSTGRATLVLKPLAGDEGCFLPLTVSLAYNNNVKGKDEYPEKGEPALQLPPRDALATTRYWLNHHRGAVAFALVMAVLLMVALVMRSRSQARQRQVMQSRVDQWESLVARLPEKCALTGTKLGRYRLLDLLGEGGMAQVYRALPEDHPDEREAVAVKIMKAEMREDPEFDKRFHREIRILVALQHPCVVQVHDWGETEDLLYVVMELVKGGTLTKAIPPGGMALETFRAVFLQVLQAVGFAHSRGIIHRDLKPDNVMLSENGKRVKVMDFGIARGRQFTTVTQSHTAMGTPTYMAPEQIRGKAETQSDQYSLGVVAFEMLTGRVPFEDDNLMTLMYHHVEAPPPPPSLHRPTLPAVLDQMILRMLAKSPQDRYPDLAAVEKHLAEMDLVERAHETAAMPTGVIPAPATLPKAPPLHDTPPTLPPARLPSSGAQVHDTPPTLPPTRFPSSGAQAHDTPPTLPPTRFPSSGAQAHDTPPTLPPARLPSSGAQAHDTPPTLPPTRLPSSGAQVHDTPPTLPPTRFASSASVPGDSSATLPPMRLPSSVPPPDRA